MELMAIRSNLQVLHSLKEAAEGRRIPYREVVKKAGVTKAQLSYYMNDKIDNFNRFTLDKLCEYYECEPGDILVRDNGAEMTMGA